MLRTIAQFVGGPFWGMKSAGKFRLLVWGPRYFSQFVTCPDMHIIYFNLVRMLLNRLSKAMYSHLVQHVIWTCMTLCKVINHVTPINYIQMTILGFIWDLNGFYGRLHDTNDGKVIIPNQNILPAISCCLAKFPITNWIRNTSYQCQYHTHVTIPQQAVFM